MISDTFRGLSRRHEGALICYIMGGDPDLNETKSIIDSLVEAGIDILEIGIPFSEPIADGKTIQAAGIRAISSGSNWKSVLIMISEIKKKHKIPIVVMTYYNILYNPGVERFIDFAKQCGVDGLIIPDLPLEESSNVAKSSKAKSMDLIMMAAPSTNQARLNALVKSSTGFIYLVSHYGVTGAKGVLSNDTINLIRRTKQSINGVIPLAVGFGISTPEQVATALNSGADGAVVGSALIELISRYDNRIERAERIIEYVSKLKSATLTSIRP
ncbi:MAG: tryptophan synthase subunit alpha [Nitrososphaerota archaeon]|nr:tryptophan synthase subunit alpha [Nitrososphaerota archaeon]